MSAADAPIQLTGSTSIYPYGVDTFTFMHNYKSWEDGEQGDVIAAAFRNRIADSVIRLEQDLINVVRSDTGDMRIAACTVLASDVKINTNYNITIPADVRSYIFYDGAAPNAAATPVTFLFGVRPANTTKMALWSSATSPYISLQYFLNILGATDKLAFQFWDASNLVLASPQYAGTMGDYIISAIFMRNK